LADLSNLTPNDFSSETLYDGQTREMLASVEHRNGQETAFIKDVISARGSEAYMKIEALMADNRKQ